MTPAAPPPRRGWIAATVPQLRSAFPHAHMHREADDLDDYTRLVILIDGCPVEALTYDGDPRHATLAATSRAAAKAVARRLGQTLHPVDSSGSWTVMGQDDTGATVRIADQLDADAADDLLAHFTADGEPRRYWRQRA